MGVFFTSFKILVNLELLSGGGERKFKLFRHMIWTLLTIFVQYYLDIALVLDLR